MKKLLITGAGGFVGSALTAMASASWETHAVYHTLPAKTGPTYESHQLDIADEIETDELICAVHPDVIIHCAAAGQFDYCFQHREAAERTNISGTGNIASAVEKTNAKMIYLSTDLVFDGDRGMYAENDVPEPCCVYGQTKFGGEKILASVCSDYCIARIALLYGSSRTGNTSFTETIADTLERGDQIRLFTDEYRSPLYVANLCEILLELAQRDDLKGLFHICGNERMSRFDFGLKLAETFGFDENLVVPVAMDEFRFKDKRPKDCSMQNRRASTALETKIMSVSDGLGDMRRIRKSGKSYIPD